MSRVLLVEDDASLGRTLAEKLEREGMSVEWARTVPLSEYRKSRRGPKKPKPEKQSGAKISHVATSKILKARKQCT